MQHMFRSATLKLTIWYLAIIMVISIAFSFVIYQLNYREVSFRLQNLQHDLVDSYNIPLPFDTSFETLERNPGNLLLTQAAQASDQMISSLLYINGVVFIAGGLGSYFLARRTLRPIAEAHEAQSRFTSDASHELRTPLSAIKTELEVNLRDANLTKEESRELLESNLEEVNKLITLTETLLHLSRLDHDKLTRVSVDIPALLEEVLRRYPAERKRFDITSRKKAQTYANEAAIEELMGILIDNALKYSPKKGRIAIRIFQQRGSIGFEIKNAGPRIPEDILPRLFDRFYRADTSRTNSAKNGYGLGLSIAKKIVTVHHGTLTVSSTPKETTFAFYLPILRSASIKLPR